MRAADLRAVAARVALQFVAGSRYGQYGVGCGTENELESGTLRGRRRDELYLGQSMQVLLKKSLSVF